jgi:hypothetical protein
MNAEMIGLGLGGHKSGAGWVACCPAHDDQNPSLSINDGNDGRVLVHCHAGCEQPAVIDALKARGLWEAHNSHRPARHSTHSVVITQPSRDSRDGELISSVPCDAPGMPAEHPCYGKPTAMWTYHNADGGVSFVVMRFDVSGERKQIVPCSLWRNKSGLRWQWKAMPAPRPIYNWHELVKRPDAPVVVVEGEKAADAAAQVFRESICITSSGGSRAANKTDWSPVAGRRIMLWPDADEPGDKYARDVAGTLARLSCNDISLIDARALAQIAPDGGTREAVDGWDAADALAEWSNIAALRQTVVGHAKPVDSLALLATTSIDAPSISVSLVRGDTIKPEQVSWAWSGWLARGKVHILAGAPGCGKTTIALNLAATITQGGAWPDGTRAPVGNVVIWSGEDDPADTLAPRLIAAGADMKRVFFVGDVFQAGKARSFDPARDIEPLGTEIKRAGGAALLMVDPIVSAVAGDSHKNAETRRGLQPLVDLTANIGAALIGITHFSKGTAGREPTERLTGSLAFGALPRVVMIAAKQQQTDPETPPPPRIFVRAKSNNGSDDGGFFYELAQDNLPCHPGITASWVRWGTPIEGSAREILADAEGATSDDSNALGTAKRFLEAILSTGPIAARTIEVEATNAGIAQATLRRAKQSLGVRIIREGFGRGSVSKWQLPHRCSNAPIDAHQEKLSIYSEREHLRAETVEAEI